MHPQLMKLPDKYKFCNKKLTNILIILGYKPKNKNFHLDELELIIIGLNKEIWGVSSSSDFYQSFDTNFNFLEESNERAKMIINIIENKYKITNILKVIGNIFK